MKTFENYLKVREAEQIGLSNDGNNNSIDNAEIKELLGLIWDRYQEELKNFIQELADKNDDNEIRDLLKRMSGCGKDVSLRNRDKLEIVPHTADRSGDSEVEDN